MKSLILSVVLLATACVSPDGGAPIVLGVDVDGNASLRYDLNTVWAGGDGTVSARASEKTTGFPFPGTTFTTSEHGMRLRRKDPKYDESFELGEAIPYWAINLFVSDGPFQEPQSGEWRVVLDNGLLVRFEDPPEG